MNKEDLMQMAREAGFEPNRFVLACTKHSSGAWVGVEDEVISLANAILERAAVECDSQAIELSVESAIANASNKKALFLAEDQAIACSNRIRALKIND